MSLDSKEIGTPQRQGWDLSSLSSALARIQRIANTNTITMARKIGFTVGLELASGKSRSADIYSELATLFHRLRLGKVTLHKWDR